MPASRPRCCSLTLCPRPGSAKPAPGRAAMAAEPCPQPRLLAGQGAHSGALWHREPPGAAHLFRQPPAEGGLPPQRRRHLWQGAGPVAAQAHRRGRYPDAGAGRPPSGRSVRGGCPDRHRSRQGAQRPGHRPAGALPHPDAGQRGGSGQPRQRLSGRGQLPEVHRHPTPMPGSTTRTAWPGACCRTPIARPAG